MLFKSLNNCTLEEVVLYLEDKTKEITEWINIHGGNSEDIHKMIEEQIQKVISDNNLSNEEITKHLNDIDNEISTIKGRLEEIDTAYKSADAAIDAAYKAADEAISNSFNSQISGLRTETQTYTNTAVSEALQEAKDYADALTGNEGAQKQLYRHIITLTGGDIGQYLIEILNDIAAPYTTLIQVAQYFLNKNVINVPVSGAYGMDDGGYFYYPVVRAVAVTSGIKFYYIDNNKEIQDLIGNRSVQDKVIKL